MQAQMLIALSAGSLRGLLARAKAPLALHDLPEYAREELDLRGLNIPTDMLAGKALADLDRIRDRADRVGCPCLMLVETDPLDLAGADARQAAAMERLRRLATAANRLGCAFVGLKLKDITSPAQLDRASQGLRAALAEMDRFEVNLLLQPHGGLLEKGDPLVDLVKKVGGFRIGALPSFQHAHESGNMRDMLRRLAPYAQAMVAQVRGFNAKGEHADWAIEPCIETLRAVGYGNMLSLEWAGKGDGLKHLVAARDIFREALKAVEVADTEATEDEA
jgi:sugar phosphate isomerase/epimerase